MSGRHRLPGVTFETVPPPAPEALPRMDVALFVGFAEMGPVHRAVEIDDVAGYRRTFGGDLPLARDPESGETLMAALAPTVRAFFSNGGVKCWVIRVARTAALEEGWRGAPDPAASGIASAGQFILPGLLAVASDGTLGLARAQARSLGSWADRLTVAARAERVPFAISALASSADQVTFTAARSLTVGALVELTDPGGSVYARVERLDGRTASASCLARFTPVPPAGPEEAVAVQILERPETHDAKFDPVKRCITFDELPDGVGLGGWVTVMRSGGEMIFLIDSVAERVNTTSSTEAALMKPRTVSRAASKASVAALAR